MINKDKVAFTGSVALKIQGGNRNPGNINLIVKNIKNVQPNLVSMGWIRNYSENSNKHFKFKKQNNKSINVFVNGSRLAPRFNNTVMVNGVRVVPLARLLEQKQQTLKNYPNNNKTLKNINKIQRLLNKPKINTSVLFTLFPKPTPAHTNNFSTPPRRLRRN